MSQATQATGRLTVKEAAVEKTAAYLAEQLEGVSATNRLSLPGFNSGTGERKRPKVDVEISGNIAGITVHLALPYPAPLRDLTEKARTHITTEVQRLTGVSVSWVDVRITQLHVSSAERTLQ